MEQNLFSRRRATATLFIVIGVIVNGVFAQASTPSEDEAARKVDAYLSQWD